LSFSVACGSSSPSSPSPTPTPTPTPPPAGAVPAAIVVGASSMGSNAYAPNPIAVTIGGSVTWTNSDSISHTSTGNNATWDSGSIPPGGNFSKTFSTAGTFPYHCAFHPGMVGTVTVQ